MVDFVNPSIHTYLEEDEDENAKFDTRRKALPVLYTLAGYVATLCGSRCCAASTAVRTAAPPSAVRDFLLGVFLEGICLVTSTGWDRMVSCGVVYGLLDSSPVASATFTEIPQQSTRQQRRVSEAVVVAVAEARAWLIVYRYTK